MFTWSFGCTGFLRAHRAAQHLDGAVRDHLVRVHVRLRARTGLPDDQREMRRRTCRRSPLARRRRWPRPASGRCRPASMLTSAQAFLMTPSARTMATGCFSQPIGKLMIERWVCAPQYLSAGTSSGPKLSVSVRVAVMVASSRCGQGGDRRGGMGNQSAYRGIPQADCPYLRNLSRLTTSAACCGSSGSATSSSVASSSSSSSECVSNRRPNSTEGSTKVRTASKGMHERFRLVAEVERDRETLVGHDEVLEPVLDDDGHFARGSARATSRRGRHRDASCRR